MAMDMMTINNDSNNEDGNIVVIDMVISGNGGLSVINDSDLW